MIYIPYGAEWELAIMKLSKKDIVNMVRRVCIERDKLEEENKELKKENKELEDRRDDLLIESGSGNLSRDRL